MTTTEQPKKGGGLAKVKNIILVLSGKGGVGKSTVCCQLAMWLSIQSFLNNNNSTQRDDGEKKVPLKIGIIDADLCGPSVSRIVGAEGLPVLSSPGIGWKPVEVPVVKKTETSASSSNPEDSPKVFVMSMASLINNPKEAIVWKGPRKDAMIKQFIEGVDWGELDYLFVDTPPGTSDEHLTLCELLNPLNPAGAIVVTTPQAISTDDVKKELHFLAKLKMRCLGIVENLSGFVCPHCTTKTNIFATGGGEKLAEKYETTFLGRIPIDPVLSYSEDLGVALWNMAATAPTSTSDDDVAVSTVSSNNKAPSAVALENVANELLKQLARLTSEN